MDSLAAVVLGLLALGLLIGFGVCVAGAVWVWRTGESLPEKIGFSILFFVPAVCVVGLLWVLYTAFEMSR